MSGDVVITMPRFARHPDSGGRIVLRYPYLAVAVKMLVAGDRNEVSGDRRN